MNKLWAALTACVVTTVTFTGATVFGPTTYDILEAQDVPNQTVHVAAILPDIPATASAQAVRVSPPPTTEYIPETTTTVVEIIPGRHGSARKGYCTQWEFLLVKYAPPGGWDVPKMSRTMERESGCEPWARSPTSDSGLLQINDINHRYLRDVLGEWVDRYTLLDPVQNVRAAAALCVYWIKAGSSCYQPWSGGA